MDKYKLENWEKISEDLHTLKIWKGGQVFGLLSAAQQGGSFSGYMKLADQPGFAFAGRKRATLEEAKTEAEMAFDRYYIDQLREGCTVELEYLVSDQGEVKEVSRERKDLYVI